MTALMYAAREGHIDAARLLLDTGADVNEVDNNAIGPLLDTYDPAQEAGSAAAHRKAGDHVAVGPRSVVVLRSAVSAGE